MKDVVCFEVNNWYTYPKFFDEWFDFESDKHEGKNRIKDFDAYAKENKLCIKVVCVDMAISLVITAPEDWVKKNIPEFEDEKWVGYCVYKYPWPWRNDYIYLQPTGVDPVESKAHEDERRRDLSILHTQFSEEELENLKPHNIMGSPSGEAFLDWTEENFGVKEWEDGKPFEVREESEPDSN